MLGEALMETCTKLGLGGSALAFGSGVYAYVVDMAASVAGNGQPVSSPAGQAGALAAGVALITALGSVAVPPIMAWIKANHDTEALEAKIADLQRQADEARRAQADALKRADEKEDRTHAVEIENARLTERLELLERRSSANSAGVENIKKVLRSEVLTGTGGTSLSPVASVVTDAYGKILTASVDIELITHWKPHEIIGHNIREIILRDLHPDTLNHSTRSFDPSIEFKERSYRDVPARTKGGTEIAVDVALTRWFEPGLSGRIEGVRFGKLIRVHKPGATDLTDPFPHVASVIPGIPTEAIRENTEAVKENTIKLTEATAKLSE